MDEVNQTLTIGQVAKLTDLSRKAIRLYEARGLLGAAQRTPAGYRLFSQRDVDALRFVRLAKNLGLQLEEIREIMDLERSGAQPCGKVVQILGAHIHEIDRAITALGVLRKTLRRVREAAAERARRGESAVVCRIIESH